MLQSMQMRCRTERGGTVSDPRLFPPRYSKNFICFKTSTSFNLASCDITGEAIWYGSKLTPTDRPADGAVQVVLKGIRESRFLFHVHPKSKKSQRKFLTKRQMSGECNFPAVLALTDWRDGA